MSFRIVVNFRSFERFLWFLLRRQSTSIGRMDCCYTIVLLILEYHDIRINILIRIVTIIAMDSYGMY